MANGGDILVTQKEHGQNPFYVDLDQDGTSRTDHLLAARVGFTIYVQKINIAVITHANGKTVTIQDTANTPVKIAVLNDFTAAAGVPDGVTYDFGPHGTALTAGKGLDAVGVGTGVVCRIHVEGYMRPSSVLTLTTTNSAL